MAVCEVVHEFFEEHMNAPVRDIQPTHFSQELVQFVRAHDRDYMVNNSTYPYREVYFHLVRHNQGRNWRAMNFNRDCWLMLMGFPLDYRNGDDIQSTIASFGRLVLCLGPSAAVHHREKASEVSVQSPHQVPLHR
jgi:hypothetical protein